ncbi:MAG: 30S ribosomal protein S11 [Candidatus Woesearchaeota archaeon]|nr:MAG: 30S ribosomal protein S11 [Candidatus Woesearchaeota archaeon]
MVKKSKIGVIHIYASHNNTIIHATDISGSETLTKVSGGQVIKQQRLKSSPTAALRAAKRLAEDLKDKGVTEVFIKVRAPGGHNGPVFPGKGAQPAIKTLTREGIKILGIEDVTPIPHGGCRKKGGRRGRRP